MLKYVSLSILGLTLSLFAASSVRAAETLDVVVTLKPVFGLVSTIMGDTAEPRLLLEGKYSPHQTSLAPSMVRRTQNADMVFWIGPSLEPYMERLLKSQGEQTRSVALEKAPGIVFLPAREGGNWQADGDAASDHDHKHHHDAIDPHFWLSIENAMRMSDFITENLSRVNPDAAAIYAANNARQKLSLAAIKNRIDQQLAPVRAKAFYVFHDAYQYFERDYGLNVLGSLTVDPDRQPGARRIREIRQRIEASKARCLFREPQFPSRIIDTIVEGRNIRVGMLDPVGGGLTSGRGNYADILISMADAVANCLTE